MRITDPRMIEEEFGGPPTLTSCCEEALVDATRLHASQFRKGAAIPYVARVLGVASLVLEDGGDEDEAIADLRTIGPFPWTRFTGGEAGSLWYYRSVRRRLVAAGTGSTLRQTQPRCRRDPANRQGGRFWVMRISGRPEALVIILQRFAMVLTRRAIYPSLVLPVNGEGIFVPR